MGNSGNAKKEKRNLEINKTSNNKNQKMAKKFKKEKMKKTGKTSSFKLQGKTNKKKLLIDNPKNINLEVNNTTNNLLSIKIKNKKKTTQIIGSETVSVEVNNYNFEFDLNKFNQIKTAELNDNAGLNFPTSEDIAAHLEYYMKNDCRNELEILNINDDSIYKKIFDEFLIISNEKINEIIKKIKENIKGVDEERIKAYCRKHFNWNIKLKDNYNELNNNELNKFPKMLVEILSKEYQKKYEKLNFSDKFIFKGALYFSELYFSAPKIEPRNDVKIEQIISPDYFNEYEYVDRRPKGKKSIKIKGIISYGFQNLEKIPLIHNKPIIFYEAE